MDIVTLAMAKAYTDKKAGYSEQNVFTFDGNPKGDSIFGGYTKISNKAPDVNTLVSVSGFMGGQPLELSAADCQVQKDDIMSYINFSGRAIAMVVYKADDEAIVGLYVICDTASNSYVSRIEFAETIHPIDPKYLPGVCLPVVELETVISSELPETVLSAADSAKMDALNGEACILKFGFPFVGNVATIRAVVGSLGVEPLFVYTVSVDMLGRFIFTNETDDGTWKCQRDE